MKRVMFAAVLCCLSMLLLCLPVCSQFRVNNVGNGGVHTIQGQVFAPNGRPLDHQITVKLQSLSFTELSLVTDQSGSFTFKRLSPGNYSVVVEGDENIETSSDTVTIDPEVQANFPGSIPMPPTPRIYTVQLTLREKYKSGEKKGVVNAKMADYPKDAVKHYETGIGLANQNNADAAIAEFRQAVSIYPGFVAAYVELGKIYVKKGQLDEAIQSFRSALRYDPKDFDAAVNLGIALLEQKNYPEAKASLGEAVTLSPDAVTPHYYLGLIFLMDKQLDDAQKELETAKRLKGDKGLPLIHRYLGGIYLMKNQKLQAVDELETYLRLDPKAKDADRIRKTIADTRATL